MEGAIFLMIGFLVIFLAWYLMRQNDISDDTNDTNDIPPDSDVNRNYMHLTKLWTTVQMRYYDRVESKVMAKNLPIGRTAMVNELTIMLASGRLSHIQFQNALIQWERLQ